MRILPFLQRILQQWLRPEPSRVPLGHRGELAAIRFLKRNKRMRIIEHSYKNHVGEVDVIAVDVRRAIKTVVFVEVKTRVDDGKGLPVEAVDDRKQAQIIGTAMVWLRQHGLLEHRFRFDVVGILWPDRDGAPEIAHYEDAFQPPGIGQMFQ